MLIHGKYIKAAALFAPKKDPRSYLNGLCFEVHSDHVILVATSGHTLCAIKVDVDPGQESGSFIVGHDLLASIDHKFDVEVTFTNGEVKLKQSGREVSGKLIDAVYPGWRRVVPAQTSGEVAQFTPENLQVALKAKRMLHDDSKIQDIYISHNGSDPAVVAMGMPDTLVLVSPFRSEEVIYNQPEFTK